jgi:hypothetical protein
MVNLYFEKKKAEENGGDEGSSLAPLNDGGKRKQEDGDLLDALIMEAGAT